MKKLITIAGFQRLHCMEIELQMGESVTPFKKTYDEILLMGADAPQTVLDSLHGFFKSISNELLWQYGMPDQITVYMEDL